MPYYKIPRRHTACCGKSCAFEPGQLIVSALGESEDALFRKDYCQSCWKAADKMPFIASWQSCISEERKKELGQISQTLSFFRALLDDPSDDAKIQARVLLAFLKKKRILRVLGDKKTIVEDCFGNELLIPPSIEAD